MLIFKPLVLVAVLFVLVSHNPGRPASPEGGFEDFTLTLATPKTRYLELQPIPIVITLKNETGSPLVGHGVLEFGTGYLQLYIDRGDGPQEIRTLSLLKKTVYARPREFKPGEEVKTIQRLNLSLNEVFPRPGTYQLHARLISIGGKEIVSSKPVEVEIVQPDALDAHALQFIREHGEPALFFTGTRLIQRPEELQQLENFVAIFGESTYADDASFLLGQVHAAKHDYQKARKFFEKLSKKSDYGFAGDAAEYLKRIEREEKKNRP